MICIDFLEFVAGKFILNLTFVQHFIGFVLTKNKNLNSLFIISKDKICTVFIENTRTGSHENGTNFIENNFTIEERNYLKNTHSSSYFT